MTTGQRIAELRKHHGLSQEALGEALGVTRQSISKWESDAALPEIEKLVALSRLFQLPVGALLGVEEPSDHGKKPKEEPSEGPGADLTEEQLHLVEQIAARYAQTQAPRPVARKKLLWIVGSAVLALFLVFHYLSGRLDQLDRRYDQLGQTMSNLEGNVSGQIAGITSRVEEILNAQNSLTADFGHSIADMDPAAGTVTFELYAVPKIYEESMSVVFSVDGGDAPVTIQGEESPGQRFSARITCPLSDDELVLSAAFVRGGVQENQVLGSYSGLESETFPWVDIQAMGFLYRPAEADAPLPLSGLQAFVRIDPWMQQYPYLDEQPEIRNLRLGLFVNNRLVCWASPDEGDPRPNSEGAVPEISVLPNSGDGVLYTFPDVTVTLGSDDQLMVGAVITDSYGREKSYTDIPYVVKDGELSWVESYVSDTPLIY